MGSREVEPRRDAAQAWTDHVAEAAERTLFPKAQSSWYLGANIDGKKRVFMPYAGGFGNYRKHLDDDCAAGLFGVGSHDAMILSHVTGRPDEVRAAGAAN